MITNQNGKTPIQKMIDVIDSKHPDYVMTMAQFRQLLVDSLKDEAELIENCKGTGRAGLVMTKGSSVIMAFDNLRDADKYLASLPNPNAGETQTVDIVPAGTMKFA